MKERIIIRPSRYEDLKILEEWNLSKHIADRVPELSLDHCLLVAQANSDLLAGITLDIDSSIICPLFDSGHETDPLVGRRLVAAAERLAIRYGITKIDAIVTACTRELLSGCGYSTVKPNALAATRSLIRRQTRYARRVFSLLDTLGIDRDYARQHRIPLQAEAPRLQSIGEDIYGREQNMSPGAARAWNRMYRAADRDDIIIQAVSGYRSVDYQLGILKRKLSRGQNIDEILQVSAAPGFSEHHTGRAIDITTPGFDVLEEVFENSPAFNWLTSNAGSYGFSLSFPRNNRHGVAYEPWHWAWS